MRQFRINIIVIDAVIMVAVIYALLIYTAGCAPPPPTVTTPQGVTAFQNLQIAKALDAIRDVAIDANAAQPPIMPTSTTRTIVTWHRSALTVLNARQAGWVTTLTTGLDELTAHLSASDKKLLTPYVTLAKTILVEVTKP